MAVPGELHALIERFDRDLRSYRSAWFNEAQARIDFINPLFALLGWDIENRWGLSETYREVVYEDRVKVGSGAKAPHYGFYAGGQRRFLEAGWWGWPSRCRSCTGGWRGRDRIAAVARQHDLILVSRDSPFAEVEDPKIATWR